MMQTSEVRTQPNDVKLTPVREILREKIPGTLVDFQDACLRLSGICASLAEIHRFNDDGRTYAGLVDEFQLLADCAFRVNYSENSGVEFRDLSTLADGAKLIEKARGPLSSLANSLHYPLPASPYLTVLTQREQGMLAVTTYLSAIEVAVGKISQAVI